MSRKKQCTPVPVIERTGTTTSRFHTKFTRQLATLSLALLWLSLLNATTPSYVLSHNSRAETHVLPQCDSTYLFTSDTIFSHTYFDSKRRKSTLTFCPQSSEQGVEVQFLDFDVAAGDTLLVYDGKDDTHLLIGQASGQGNNNAFGGKICSPHSTTNNPEGCLTFVFQTNGDGNAGTGWQATVSCAKQNLDIILPSIPNQQLVCGESYTTLSIPSAQLINNCGVLNNDYTFVKIKEITTDISCGETILSATKNSIFTHPFGVGTFQLEYISALEPTLSDSLRFTIAPSPLVCEAEVQLAPSETCELVLLPEMFVKDYCPPINNKLHYNIILRDKEDNIIANGSTLNNDFPNLPLNALDLCGNKSYLVEIQQVFTIEATNGRCTKDKVVQNCIVPLIIKDETAPIFIENAQVDTFFSCQLDLHNMMSILSAPQTTDNCSFSQAQLESILPFNKENKCTAQPDYIITWRASDLCGNSTIRIDTLKVLRPKIVRNFSATNITESCESAIDIATIEINKLPYLQEGIQVNGQFQPMDKIELSFTDVVCDYQLHKEEEIRSTNCGKEIIRSWSIIDNCSVPPISIPIDIQIIQLLDTLAPIFANCSNFATRATAEQIALPANSCQITLNFPLPIATDNCDDKPIVKEFTVQELVNGEWSTRAVSLFQLPLSVGTFRVGYTTINDCELGGQPDTCYRHFVINGSTTPTIDCSNFSSLETAQQFDLPNNSCDINISLPIPGVIGNCEPATVEISGVQELVNGQWTNIATSLDQMPLPAGTYRILYTLNTNNTVRCYRYFIIKNTTTPTINCSEFATLATAELFNLPSSSCQISINLPIPTILNNCDNLSAREVIVQELVNGQWIRIASSLSQTPLPTGTFRVGYVIGTNNTDICYRYFIIRNTATPAINCSEFNTLATAEQINLPANSCQINITFPLPTVLGACGSLIAQETTVQELINGQWTRITTTLAQTSFTAGSYRVGYTISTNTDICYRYFIVINSRIPVINCSDFTTLATAEIFEVPANSCQINLNFPPPTVLDNCDNLIVNETAVQVFINGQWSTIGTTLAQTPFTAGSYRVGYTISTNTNDICYRHFVIINPRTPTINCSEFNTLATAELFELPANSCQINLNFPPPTVLDNCDNLIVSETAVEEFINGQWFTIGTTLAQTPFTTGSFRVGYTIGTNTTDICYRHFVIINPRTPTINCTEFNTLATAELFELPTDSCQINLNFPVPTILDNCDNLIVRETAVQEFINGQWFTIATTLAQTPFTTGSFRVGYTIGTNTTDICYRHFVIINPRTPTINCTEFNTLATAELFELPANSCQINLNFPPPTVLDNCDNLIAKETAVQELINGQWVTIANTLIQTPLHAGSFRVGYTISSNPTDICYRHFVIINPTTPAINCTEFNTLATAEQIDLPSNSCQINLNFPPPTVLNNCGNLSAREIRVQELVNGIWVNIAANLIQTPLSTGTFRVGYAIGINTTNVCYRYFVIRSSVTPSINCSEFSTLATAEQFDLATSDCQINLNFPLPTVLNNCDNLTTREVIVEELINGEWIFVATSLAQTPITTGTFRVGYAIDANNTIAIATCYRYFIIRDSVTPTINCSTFASLATAEIIDLPVNSCQVNLNFPLPAFVGNCATTGIREVALQELSNGIWTNLPSTLSQTSFLIDTFRVAYTLVPNNLLDTCYRYFIVRDTIAPFVDCRQDIAISLDENGRAVLDANTLSLANGDNCSPTQLLINRNSCLEGDMRSETDSIGSSERIDLSEFATSIEFECCDLGRTIRLELLVLDESGNYSTCSATTVATDMVLPICEALPAITGFCNEFQTTDFGRPSDVNGNEEFDEIEWLPILPAQLGFYNEEFGNPFTACRDNITCLNLRIEQEYQLIEGICNSIRVKRRYRAVDFSGNVSAWTEQMITIEYQPNWLITFPADEFTNCEVDKITAPLSPIRNGACDMLSWTATDEVIEFTTGGILEVIRTFTVVNNCVPQPDGQWEELDRLEDEQGIVRTPLLVRPTDFPGEGHFSYIQKIRIVDNDAPFLVLGPVDTLLFGKGDAEPFGEEDITREGFPFECDEVREFSIFARDCTEPSTATLSFNWEFSNNGQVVETGVGNSFFQTVLPDTLYTVNWTVEDVFGNQSDTTVTYQFVDAAPPTPICAEGITASISPTTRMVTVSVDTLDGGSFDNCDDQSNLGLFILSDLTRINRPQTLAEIQALPTEFTFNCTDAGEQELLLYVTDDSGNFAACTSIIEIVMDATIDCDETMVGGTIVDHIGAPIQNTSITILGQDMESTIHSNAAGNYDIRLPMNENYTIKPTITTKPLNGISTYDLVLLSQHILGTKTFTSPYQYIAGDVNRSGTITAFDLVQLRQLILNQIKEFPNNDSWRFVSAAYEFKATNPLRENIEEAYKIQNLAAENVYMDFVGVKVGDLNGDANTANLQETEQRQSGTNFYLHTTDQRLEKGKFYTVSIHAPQLENIIGFQGTFKFHDLILTNITGGKVTPEHFYGWRQGSIGYLTTSWHSLYSHDNNTVPYLFNLTFQAMTDGLLHEFLQITSKPTTAEAYSFSGEWLNLSLTFQNKDRKNDLNFGFSPPPSASTRETTAMLPLEGGVFEVFPNKPNPFDDYTIISFYIPQPTLTALSIFNIHGQSILQTQQIYPTGTNQIKFDSDQLPNGTYFYQVATPYGVATHKMVVAK